MACPPDSLLLARAQGHQAGNAAELELHLDTCGDCRKLLAWAVKGRLDAPGRETEVPQQLGRYRVLDALGAGGMGVVYLAHDPQLDRHVALKLVHPRPSTDRPELQRRLLREAQALAKLAHPNVVAVHDVGEANGQVYLAMEHVRGTSLRRWLSSEKAARSTADVLSMFEQAGRGLAAAHEASVIHRDFKPENVLIGLDGRARVSDFGLATLTGRELLGRPVSIGGTPGYIAPEQLAGAPVDSRADQYAFCVALEEALGSRGSRPVRRALERGRSTSPQDRFPSMAALLHALIVVPRFRRRAALTVAACLCVTALVSAAVMRDPARVACGAAARRLDDLWSPAVRAQLRVKLEQSRSGTGSAARVDSLLEAFAGQWRVAHQEACSATFAQRAAADAPLTLRLRCLETRLRDFAAATELLAQGGEDVGRHALATVAALEPALRTCSRVELLSSVFALPEDPRAREAVQALEQRLSRLRALASAGRRVEALKGAREVVAQAGSLGWEPTRAEALLLQGALETQLVETVAAARTLHEAAAAAVISNRDELAARAWILLVRTKPENAEERRGPSQAATIARAYLTKLGNPPELEAAWASSVGAREGTAGRHEEALRHFQRALALHQQYSRADAERLVTAHNNVGAVLGDLRQLDAATAQYDLALKIAREELGSEHPAVSLALFNQAVSLAKAGQYARAEPLLRACVELRRRTLGEEGPDTTVAQLTLASLLGDLGRADEALALQLEVLPRVSRGPGHESPQYATALSNLGRTHLRVGQPELAANRSQEALALKEKLFGPEDRRLVTTLQTLGDAELQRGRPGVARAHLQRGFVLAERHHVSPEELNALRRSLSEATRRAGRDSRL